VSWGTERERNLSLRSAVKGMHWDKEVGRIWRIWRVLPVQRERVGVESAIIARTAIAIEEITTRAEKSGSFESIVNALGYSP
jgi:phosphate uptake regulator